ncbi:MAG: type II toxin-antitoxin system VapC family toxin [Ignavibacteria bacterium]|nr:type II toxin-antitoxin system VapC family toxin [Ignavibacteria bacterium]
MTYLYDTNIFIDFFSGRSRIDEIFSFDFINQNDIIISQINRIELLSHPNILPAEEKMFEFFLNSFRIININTEIEKLTIQLRRKYKLKLPDAIIASTAISENAEIVTRDLKDFSKIKELKLYK